LLRKQQKTLGVHFFLPHPVERKIHRFCFLGYWTA